MFKSKHALELEIVELKAQVRIENALSRLMVHEEILAAHKEGAEHARKAWEDRGTRYAAHADLLSKQMYEMYEMFAKLFSSLDSKDGEFKALLEKALEKKRG